VQQTARAVDLALFDFDGTLTTRDTFRDFVYFSSGPLRTAVGTLVLGPLLVGYRRGLVSAALLRQAAVAYCFRNRRMAELEAHGRRFAQTFDSLLRPEAMAKLRWHQGRGDQVAIVSASLSIYLRPWCEPLGVDLLCSELEAQRGISTGRYVGRDCSGEEKARRVRARYDLKSFEHIYAYGDTADDHPMLGLATHRFFCGNELDPSLCAEAASRPPRF